MEKAKQINPDDKLDVTSDDKSEKTWKRIKIFKTIMLVFPFAAMVRKRHYTHRKLLQFS